MSDKIEGVSKVSQTMKTESADGMEQTGNEKFQSHMDSHSSIQTSFERLDPKNFAVGQVDSSHIEVKETPISNEDVSSQKSGSATDQEQKRQQQDSESDEVEGISGVEGAKKKNKASDIAESGRTQSEGVAQVSMDDVKKQTQEAVSKIEEAKSQLAQANQAHAEIKPSYQKLLRNHLTHIDDNIKIASSKLGVEGSSEVKPASSKGGSPVERFLDMLTRSEHEMKNLQKTVEAATSAGKEMSPGQMLALQIKTNLITQEIELFTNLLNKAIESTKTIMNVQV